MAQAFGGKIEKARQGWGIGIQRYDILEQTPWMDGVSAVRATASHQDQVTSLPRGSRVLGASNLTPNKILAYDDHPSLSVQFHPEFAPEYSRALLKARCAPDLTQEDLASAIESLDGPNNNLRLGRWINRFLAD